MNIETASATVRTIDKAVKSSEFSDKQNEKSVEAELLIEGASGAASSNVGTMDEAVSDAAVPDQQN